MKIVSSSISLCLAMLANGLILGSALAQSIVDVVPSPNELATSPNTTISGTLKSGNNISIPPNSVKIWIDGKNVTPSSRIDLTSFQYRPQTPFTAGKHIARIDFKGSDGIARFVTWDFTVSAAPEVQVTDPKSAISSISHNAFKGLDAGSLFQATMRGNANQKASILLIRADANNNAMQEFAAREVSPGEYLASFTVGSAPLREGIVLGRLKGKGRPAYAVAELPARFNRVVTKPKPTPDDPATQIVQPTVKRPLKPTLTSHQDGDRILTRTGFVLKGQTQPGATVMVNVVSAARSLGGILGSIVGGNVLVDKSVTADSQGDFEVEVPRPLVVNKGTRYQVEAIAELKNLKSEALSLELIQN